MIDKLRDIVNSDLPEKIKLKEALKAISQDESTFLLFIEVLKEKIDQDKELITDLNFELSRSSLTLVDGKPDKNFVISEIKKFYEKWSGRINHCFSNPFKKVK